METILDFIVQDKEFKDRYRLSISVNKVGFNSTGVMTLEEISKRFSIPMEDLKLIIRK